MIVIQFKRAATIKPSCQPTELSRRRCRYKPCLICLSLSLLFVTVAAVKSSENLYLENGAADLAAAGPLDTESRKYRADGLFTELSKCVAALSISVMKVKIGVA